MKTIIRGNLYARLVLYMNKLGDGKEATIFFRDFIIFILEYERLVRMASRP